LNPKLAKECIETAEALYAKYKNLEATQPPTLKTHALIELIISTNKEIYKKDLIALSNNLDKGFERIGWTYSRVLPFLADPAFAESAKKAALVYKPHLDSMVNSTSFGIPLQGTEYIGFRQYYLNKAWPDIFTTDNLFNALNYLFGCRPGNTTNSLIPGVGANSPTITYSANRADWSYVPEATFWNAVKNVHFYGRNAK